MDASEQLALFKWIAQAGPAGIDECDIVGEVGRRLNAGGISVARVGVGFPTLHPTVAGFDISWYRDEDRIERGSWSRALKKDDTVDFDAIPFAYLSRNDLPEVVEDLTGDEPSRFPLVQRLKKEGATGYLATSDAKNPGLGTGPLSTFFTSWATDRQGGFTNYDLDVIRALIPALGTTIRAIMAADVTYDLLRTYLGNDAARKVIEGSVLRGEVEVIDAVIVFADLAGFTQASDRETKEDLADLLNDYFDVLVDTLRDHGGEVLKFIGDGLLAIFRLDQPKDVVKAALDASALCLTNVDALSAERAEAGKITSDVSIALHRGELLFGNVGAEDRLDFTVIGPAVNEASRIEALCRGEQRRLIISSAFADSAGREVVRLISLGKFALRGVRKPQRLYTLDMEAE